MAATAVGVKSSGTVTGWKNGAAPRQGVLRKLADYFGVSTEDLLTGDSPGDKKERPAENGEALEKDLPETSNSCCLFVVRILPLHLLYYLSRGRSKKVKLGRSQTGKYKDQLCLCVHATASLVVVSSIIEHLFQFVKYR